MDIKISRYKKYNKIYKCELIEYKVTINGKQVNVNNRLDGSRDKFTYKNIIIKVDSDTLPHAATEIDKYKIIEEDDKQYFPRLVKYNRRIGYIIQEKLDLTVEGITEKHSRLVRKLVKKYKLTDISCGKKRPWNWAINKNTGLPIIFDLGYPS